MSYKKFRCYLNIRHNLHVTQYKQQLHVTYCNNAYAYGIKKNCCIKRRHFHVISRRVFHSSVLRASWRQRVIIQRRCWMNQVKSQHQFKVVIIVLVLTFTQAEVVLFTFFATKCVSRSQDTSWLMTLIGVRFEGVYDFNNISSNSTYSVPAQVFTAIQTTDTSIILRFVRPHGDAVQVDRRDGYQYITLHVVGLSTDRLDNLR